MFEIALFADDFGVHASVNIGGVTHATGEATRDGSPIAELERVAIDRAFDALRDKAPIRRVPGYPGDSGGYPVS